MPHLAKLKPEHFAVFGEAEVKLAKGDTVRITSNGRDVTGKHRLDNGRIDNIKGFTQGGDMMLANGWVLGKDFAHLKHGLVSDQPGIAKQDGGYRAGGVQQASLGAMSVEQG